MGNQYRHLTEQDRTFLRIMLEKRYSKAKIAHILGVHRSTIYRELKRNSWTHWLSKTVHYTCFKAQDKYIKRRQRSSRLQQDSALRKYVSDKLRLGWSPWQIEGRLKRENSSKCMLSHETIYRYIYSDYAIRNRFYKKLRRKHFLRIKHHSRKLRIAKEYMIDNRPKHINQRLDFGHWECDLMIFKRGIKGNLITLRERKTRFVIAIKNANKTAKGTAIALISTLKNIKQHVKSITFDQGSEFKKYPWLESCLKTAVYFCHPASPYEKGGIENANGVIRVELPRSVDIGGLKQKDVVQIADEINGRPLKCLEYQTPEEVFKHFAV
jgi:transposase, IS30 family